MLPESLAITLYLARTHGREAGLQPTPHEDAQAQRWSLWAQGHVEPWVNHDAVQASVRDTLVRSEVLTRALGTLERALSTPWLSGARFGVADLNVAGVLSPSRAASLDLQPHPRIRDWLARCYDRPACSAARGAHNPSSTPRASP